MQEQTIDRQFIILTVTKFLTQDDLSFTVMSKEAIRVPVESKDVGVFIHCSESTRVLTMIREHENGKIPPQKRDAVVEYIARANYGMRSGNFNLDLRTGTLGFQVSTFCGDFQPTELEAQARCMFYVATGTYAKYRPGLKAVLERNVSPAEAVSDVESGRSRENNAVPANREAPRRNAGREVPQQLVADEKKADSDPLRKLAAVLAAVAAGQPVDADLVREAIGHSSPEAAAAAVAAPGNENKTSGIRDGRAGLLGLGEIAMRDLHFRDAPSELLGEGGFGRVIKGELLGLPVAIKMLKKAEGSDDMVRLFEDEMLLQRQMVFPRVLQVIGVASQRDRYFLVTELCHYKSVADCLRDHRELLTKERRLRFLLHAAQGMAFLHNRSIVHLDLKPQNLMVDKDFNVKVGDFGLAKVMTHTFTSKIRGGGVGGTLPYMAPEVLDARISNAADVYSYSITAWEILSGRMPYEELLEKANGKAFQMMLMRQVLSGYRPQPMPAGYPSAVLDIIQKGWSADPDARPTFLDIIDVLGREVDE